jgi:5-methylcytosine-specific restriction endonuclease McrA
MFNNEQDPLALLIELTPKRAKRRFRESIYNSWDNKCAYCGAPATSLDHVIPRYRSGSSNRNNLIPACQRCNSNKASYKMEEWYRKQEFFCETRLIKINNWVAQETIDIYCLISGPVELKLA